MSDIAAVFRQRAERFTVEMVRFQRIDHLVARARVAVFLIGTGIFAVGWMGDGAIIPYETVDQMKKVILDRKLK